MQRIFALVLLAALSTIGLSGCGNKGPLYLPPEPVEEVPAAQEAPAAPEVSADAEQP
ncbi:LPS translocon maturation chaperone LptM [Porticoccus sp.]